jgi:hypothetical protein
MRVLVSVQVAEDGTAVENFIPGFSGGDARMLGVGTLDVTSLCLGDEMNRGSGVLDAWIPISMKGQELEELQDELFFNKNDPLAPLVKLQNIPKPPPVTGMVRVLVSYQPNGLEPQARDVIALECFARRNPITNSCQPVLSPLAPLTVLERRGSYMLAEYTLADKRKACLRLHRNAVFVIERKNIVDAAHNLALLPLDVVAATPVGRATGHLLGPVLAASRELLMPALLSLKLVWFAARTTTLAGFSGVHAVGSTMWNEGSSSLTQSHQPDMYSDENQRQRERRAATAKFVSL